MWAAAGRVWASAGGRGLGDGEEEGRAEEDERWAAATAGLRSPEEPKRSEPDITYRRVNYVDSRHQALCLLVVCVR